MLIANRKRIAATVALAAFAFVFSSAPVFAANGGVDPQEAKCASALGKAAAKVAKTVLSNTSKCRNAGNGPGSCPDATAQAKISGAQEKLIPKIVKTCASVCSISTDVPCIGDNRCPPLTSANELCSAGPKAILFDILDIGFPGPFCEGILGHEILLGDDLGECVGLLVEQPASEIIDVVYGSIDPSTLTSDQAKCLSSIGKSAAKLSDAIVKGVVKCRKAIFGGALGDPATCRDDDPKVAAKIQKAEDKLTATVASKCSPGDITALDLCGNGIGGTPDIATAQACLVEAVNEITDTTVIPVNRQYSSRSIVEAAYPPPRGVCGDSVANQVPNPFQLLGEECDGVDDSACPGLCLPPGDVYQCTCADRALVRFFADGLTADLDSGWTGTSHDSGVADNAGYINEATNCDCSMLTGATCTGTTADAVCDMGGGFQLPTCSWDPFGATRCDAHGNNNGSDANSDCARCDVFTANAGDFCVNESHCSPQCFDTNGDPQGPCGPPVPPSSALTCPAGQICRGQCDDSATCIIIPNGAPLPISSGGTPVCVLTTFRENIFGTRNIVTGEHEVFIQQFSKVHLGLAQAVPCPLCGGFCVGSGPSDSRKGEVCEGTCSVTTSTQCRFNSDCPGGETCTSASPQCPGSSCNLSLICGGGVNPSDQPVGQFGSPCRLEAFTTDFGTTSNDCLPFAGKNISGQGLAINFFPSTSEAVTLPASLACNAPGFELFDCPCPSAGGLLTQPNNCAGACDTGAERGQGCGIGAGNIGGAFTTCAGGDNIGDACDEDDDCPSSTCSDNPSHCTGGSPGDELKLCTTNGDCGGGGTCVDACPSGRCVPLCLTSDDPDAPVNTKNDAEEGICAAGPPSFHCSGENATFRTCTAGDANGGCSAVCAASCSAGGVPSGGSGNPCNPSTPCGGGEICCGTCGNASPCEAGVDAKLGTADDIPGAGICTADVKNCAVNDFAAEGGDTFNGLGDPTNVRSVSTYCIGATSNPTVNNTAGLGGPGRLRQRGEIVANKNTIP